MSERKIRKKNFRYILFYKPYGVVCQFSKTGGESTLSDFGPFPPDVYPAGRLDADSEGLVLLTNDGELQHRLLQPKYGHKRTYLVQVEGIPQSAALQKLRSGLLLDGRRTRPAGVRRLSEDPALPPRSIPIRVRKSIPTSWLELTLREGRNRQVRRMTAAVGNPTLRLIRVAIEFLTLEGLNPGEYREVSSVEQKKLLGMISDKRKFMEEVSDGT